MESYAESPVVTSAEIPVGIPMEKLGTLHWTAKIPVGIPDRFPIENSWDHPLDCSTAPLLNMTSYFQGMIAEKSFY